MAFYGSSSVERADFRSDDAGVQGRITVMGRLIGGDMHRALERTHRKKGSMYAPPGSLSSAIYTRKNMLALQLRGNTSHLVDGTSAGSAATSSSSNAAFFQSLGGVPLDTKWRVAGALITEPMHYDKTHAPADGSSDYVNGNVVTVHVAGVQTLYMPQASVYQPGAVLAAGVPSVLTDEANGGGAVSGGRHDGPSDWYPPSIHEVTGETVTTEFETVAMIVKDVVEQTCGHRGEHFIVDSDNDVNQLKADMVAAQDEIMRRLDSALSDYRATHHHGLPQLKQYAYYLLADMGIANDEWKKTLLEVDESAGMDRQSAHANLMGILDTPVLASDGLPRSMAVDYARAHFKPANARNFVTPIASFIPRHLIDSVDKPSQCMLGHTVLFGYQTAVVEELGNRVIGRVQACNRRDPNKVDVLFGC